jgi:predicted RNase H-like HicB family nuclease
MRDAHYIALIHKDADSGYGVSFPDVAGVIAVADTLDDAIAEAAAALAFAFEDSARDAQFQAMAADAVIAAVRPSHEYYHAAE